MSFEGYYEKLCSNGHRRVFDALDYIYDDSSPEPCSCGAQFVFSHLVDETNCDPHPYPFEVAIPEQRETCNLGHSHIVRETVYKIPKIDS